MKQFIRLAIITAVATALVPSASGAMMKSSPDLRSDMRKLWEDHVTWTRLFIVSALGELPDKAATTDRLLKNQVDIGNAIKPFYGNEAGDTAKLGTDKARWVANADEIAGFLSAANPKNWPAADMKKMMREHLDATTAELMARINKDWAADVAAYEKVHAQILHMADMLTDGIAKQFPEKVKDRAA